jgi:hypothetical protein
MTTEKGTSIISKIDKIGNVIFPLVLAILGILNITGKVPAAVQMGEGVFLVAVPAALTIWNIIFPSERVTELNQ